MFESDDDFPWSPEPYSTDQISTCGCGYSAQKTPKPISILWRPIRLVQTCRRITRRQDRGGVSADWSFRSQHFLLLAITDLFALHIRNHNCMSRGRKGSRIMSAMRAINSNRLLTRLHNDLVKPVTEFLGVCLSFDSIGQYLPSESPCRILAKMCHESHYPFNLSSAL